METKSTSHEVSSNGSTRVIQRLGWYMMAVSVVLVAGLYFLKVDHWYYILPAFPVFGLVLWINSSRHYLLARNILIIGSFLLFVFWAFTHRRTGAEYGLIAVFCSIPMVCKETRLLIIGLVVVMVTLVVYFLVDRLTPFVPNPTINYPLLSTAVLVMAGGNVFVQILLYRNTLVRYMSAIKEKNRELDQVLEEKRHTQVELETSNEQLRALTTQLNWIVKQKTRELQTYIDAINVNIYSSIVDLDGKIMKANAPLLEATGYDSDELMGQSYRLFHSQELSERQYARFESSIRQGTVWRGEVKYRTKSNGFFWGDQVVIPMRNAANEISYFLTLGLPITERKVNEEMRNKTLSLLQKLAFETSHNVRGPIARLLGLVSLIQNKMVDAQEIQYVMKQLANTTHELNLVTSGFVEFLNTHRDLLNQQGETGSTPEQKLSR
ncbi:MAG: PAS domain-containing protein [Cyclobacteriaceae bacterium]|jgi:PAS domain S-box-containing protein|nr:PAS domain-containing protein [Cyclobacteriaceae bacterium]